MFGAKSYQGKYFHFAKTERQLKLVHKMYIIPGNDIKIRLIEGTSN